MASPAMKSSALLLLLLIVLFSSDISFSLFSDDEEERVSREFFPMEGDVAWVVQVSDLHLSVFHPDRGNDLVRLLAPVLRVIRPAFVLVTGDITDAKNRRRTSSRQDESEWIQYRNSVDALVNLTGMEKRRIFDIRGNHDKYGVPYVGCDLDYFSTYSVSSQFNRLGTIQSITLVGDDQNYIFVGIDDTMSIGIRGPSNLFGHPTGKRIAAAEAELQYWNAHPGAHVTKVVFGHFPMSFTASTEKGERYETVFAKHSISAYICGHLHATFGKQLWRLHSVKLPSNLKEPKRENQFWEWELGDWKDFRFIRILAIDGGKISFLDVELPVRPGLQGEFQTILITHPTDSRITDQNNQHNQMLRNDINALVFSAQPVINVTAKVFDSSRDFKVVEEIPLKLASNNSPNKPFFHSKWNAESYRSVSANRYWLQVFASDSEGNMIASNLRPFSVEGRTLHLSPTWLAYLIFYLQWESIYSFLLWSNICFLSLLLFLPKLLNLFMERSTSYQKWAMSVSISSTIKQRNLFFSLLWFLIEGSRNNKLWSVMAIYLLYLLSLPWFWGFATSQNGDIAEVYLFGWRIRHASSSDQRLGVPDLLAISLPFMYFVIAPLFLVTYSLAAERAAACLHISRKTEYLASQVALVSEENGAILESYKETTGPSEFRICGGWLRKFLLFSTGVIACIHLKLALVIMTAYGMRPVALSPAFAWVPPLLLAAAVYSTMHSDSRPRTCMTYWRRNI